MLAINYLNDLFFSVEINSKFKISFTLIYSQIYEDKINAKITNLWIRMFFYIKIYKNFFSFCLKINFKKN